MSDSPEQFDAAIIGGGVIGCSIAWRLAQAGMSVAIIERGEPGAEASFAAGGMLAPMAEADRADDFFRLALAGRAMYSDFARELQAASGVNIEYRTEGVLYLAMTEEDEEELDRRWQWQHAAGLNVKRLNAECVLKIEPSINQKTRWALKFPDDHQVNNRLLVEALRVAAMQSGVHLLTQTEARHLLIETVGGRRRISGVATSRDEIKTTVVVVAAGSWSSLLTFQDGRENRPLNQFGIEPVRGQMISVEMPAPEVQHVIYSRRGYLIPRMGGLLIAGSTSEFAGFDNRITAGGIASIIQHASEILPQFGDLAITETWAGCRPRSNDELPILGPDPAIGGLIYATGHYRNGILLTPITSQAISELILNGESLIKIAPFSPARFTRRPDAG